MSILDKLKNSDPDVSSDDSRSITGEFNSRPMTNRAEDEDGGDNMSEQPSQLQMVHQELDLLINSLETKQVGVQDRQPIIDSYAELMSMVADLIGEYKEIKWIPISENPTMDEMAEIINQNREHLVSDFIKSSDKSQILYNIYNQSQRMQKKVGEADEFEYAYAETGIEQTYGHKIQSFGIPNGIDPERLPEGEDGEEVYSRGRALKAMEELAQDPSSPLWLGVGTRNGRDASVEKDVLFRHRAIFGQTGYGKSTLLTNDAKQLIESGAGMCFIDPKGDDSQRLMQLIPDRRLDDVLWIEPGAEGDHLSGFNYITLGMDPDDDGYDVARSNLVSDLKKMLKMSADYWGPRMDRVAANLITAMNMYNDKTPDDAPEMNLVDLYYILKSEASRKEFAARCKKAGLKFVDDYTQEIAEMNDDDLEPLLGRFLPWIQNPIARRMIGFREGGINIPKAIDDNKIIIVRMGSEPRELKQMLGMAVIRRIWSRIRSRANESIYAREPFYLFVDEFDNIALADETIPSIISESRSYRLSLNIANQYPKQLPGNVVDAITTNCDTIISFNPGDLQSARQYSTQLGVEPEKLTDEVNYHVWLRTTLSSNMEKSDAFRAYVYPPHPPKREEDKALAAIEDSLRKFGRPRRSDEETYQNLLFNGGGGKWETGIGAEIEMIDDDDIVKDLEIQLRQQVPSPDNPGCRSEAVFDEGDVDEAETTPTVGPMADAESVIDQKQEEIFEAIFAAAVQDGKEPGAFIPTESVVDELKIRLEDDISIELSEVANAFEKLSSKYVERERLSGEPHIRLTKSGQAKVFDQDTGSAGTGGGEEHRWILRKSYGIFTRLGYITNRPKQDGDELPDAIAEAPFDFTDVDPTLAPNKKVERIEERRQELQEEHPEVWNLSKGNDVSIEAETTTIDTPVRMITNLRKAVERGNTCVFATKEGEDNFTEWAKKGEKNIYKTKEDPNSPESEIVSDDVTFMKAVGRDGIPRYYNKKTSYQLDEEKVVLRPQSSKRGSVWYKDPDTGDIVCAPANSTEIEDDVEKIRFDSIEQIDGGDPTAVPAYYEYDRSEKQYIVNDGGSEYVYPSKSELKEDWEEINAPLIPEIMFDEMPSEEDWVFIIYPDADNEEYDQPQIYDRGECKPLFDTLGADIDSVEVNRLNEGAGERQVPTDLEDVSSQDEGNTNAPGEYTAAAQEAEEVDASDTDTEDADQSNPVEEAIDSDVEEPTDTDQESVDSEQSDVGGSTDGEESQTEQEKPPHEISTIDQRDDAGDRSTTDQPAAGDSGTEIPTVSPRQIADHPSINMSTSRIGRIGAGSTVPSEEEFNTIRRRLKNVDVEAAEYVEEVGHLTHVIETAGSTANTSEPEESSEDTPDSSESTASDDRANDAVPPQQGDGEVEVDPEIGEEVTSTGEQIDQKADKLGQNNGGESENAEVSESVTNGSDRDSTQPTQQSQQNEHESTQQPHTPSDESVGQQSQTSDDTTEKPTGVCPDCRYNSEFDEDPVMGVLFCGNCGYTPKKEIRERLRPDGKSAVEINESPSPTNSTTQSTASSASPDTTQSENTQSTTQPEQPSGQEGGVEEGEVAEKSTTQSDESDTPTITPPSPDPNPDQDSSSEDESDENPDRVEDTFKDI